jgi:hypothetical protein
MPFDSTADLLFRIGADTGDAEGNIQRFRALLGENLSDLSGQFSDWSTKVFGDLSTVSGAMTAMGAVGAAVAVAVGAALEHCANSYAEYVEQVERGSRISGISTEAMSGMHLMAQETGVSYDSLVRSLARFASVVHAAQSPTSEQAKTFHDLGITQEQVNAGQKDMLPLLELVMDRMHQLGASSETTAAAKALLRDRTGELTRMLALGGEALKDYIKKARDLGETVLPQDVLQVEQYRASLAAMKTEQEALEVTTGRTMLPLKTDWEELKVSVLKAVAAMVSWKTLALAVAGPHTLMADFVLLVKQNMKELAEETERTAKALSHLGGGGGGGGTGGGGGGGGGTAKELEEYRGISDVLTEIMSKQADLAGPVAKAADEADRLQDRLDEAREKLKQLHAEGKVSAEDYAGQMQDLRVAAVLLLQLMAQMTKKAGDAVVAAVAETGEQLRNELLKQGPQTLAVKLAEWDAEIAQRRAKIVQQGKEQGADETANLALLGQVYQAGVKKIWDDAGKAAIKGNEELDAKLAGQLGQTHATRVAALDREVADLVAEYSKEGQLTEDQAAKIAEYRRVGLEKIAAEEEAAGKEELARLGEQLERIEKKHQSAAERIKGEYAADLAKFTETEEKKSLVLATSEAQRAQIHAQFAAIYKALLEGQDADLQELKNSQGWQGVFGAKFGETIRGNEALLKEWQSSTNQSAMMVKVALEGLKEMAKQAFGEMAQGMAGAIAQGLVYEKSIGKAMEASLKSTLASLSAEAYVRSIYSLALGFFDLAQGNAAGAAAAFEAAALFAAVGTAVGFAGRAIPGGGAGGTGGAETSGNRDATGAGGRGSGDSTDSQMYASAGRRGPSVTVNVFGHVVGTSGVAEFAGLLNDAVMNQGVTLTATNTTTGRQVQQ